MKMHVRRSALVVCLALSCGVAASSSQHAKNTEPFNAGISDASSLKAAVDGRVAAAKRLLAELLAVEGRRTIDNTLQPYDDLVSQLHTASALANNVESLHPEPAMRAAAAALRPSFQGVIAQINLSRGVFDALAGIDPASVTDAVSRRYLDREIAAYRLRGIDKPAAVRERLQQLRIELNAASAEFQKNIREGGRTLRATAAELEGVPRDYLARHKQDADGNITLTTNAVDIRPVLQFARNADLRRRALVASDNVAYPENGPVLKRILSVRSAIATALGFEHWAAYDAASRMTKDVATVSAFIDKVAKASEAKARAEYAQLLERKKRDDAQATSLSEWERPYYAELVRREQYDVDSQEVRQYFPSERVIAGVMDTASRMYGVTFRPVIVPVWHPSVRAFEMFDGGMLLGRFYLDLFPRDGKAAAGASHTAVRTGSSRHTPESVIVAALPGGDSGPGLMSHDEVRTLFHEFGHLLHSLFASHGRWHGVNGLPVEADAREVASMLAEEWVWDARTLQTFARHHSTGAAIPEALVIRLRRAGEFGKAMTTRLQIGLSKVALSYHDRTPGDWDPSMLRQDVMARYVPTVQNGEGHMEAAWPHLSNPNYASAYYGYTWSQVIAKDLFEKFDKDDLLKPAVARRYRGAVLAPGSSKPANDLFEDYLGRPFSIAPWERWLNQEAGLR